VFFENGFELAEKNSSKAVQKIISKFGGFCSGILYNEAI
jgi:hypothetical protein